MTKRKVAMVQPPPLQPSDLPIFADPQLEARLTKTLLAQHNDRSYTVLEYHDKWASVHFEGDREPKTITYK